MWVCNTCESATHVSLQHMWACNTCESATHMSLQHMWVCNTCESATHVSVQHMWVCNTCESATHVSLQHMWVCNTCESATPNYRAKESATLLLSRAPLLRQTCCSVLLHYIAVYYSVLQRVCSLISVLPPDHEVLATRCNTLQHTTIHGNTLQNTADALPLSA